MSKIQILKGDVGKSITVEQLRNDNSVLFVYAKSTLPIGDYYINSDEVDAYELKNVFEKAINEIFIEHNNTFGAKYEFLIIYTNEEQDELDDFMDWLNDYQDKLNARLIIVTCK